MTNAIGLRFASLEVGGEKPNVVLPFCRGQDLQDLWDFLVFITFWMKGMKFNPPLAERVSCYLVKRVPYSPNNF